MTRERDTDKGRFQPEHTDDDFITAVADLETQNSLPSTGDIATKLNCSRETARRWLTELADDGQLQKIEVGNAFAWTRAKSER